ncbi:MAG: EutN/CcmL family microcompartment protein [Actinomycetota bacterium]|nr:EutN/CcmL family microcompartment protein [Actinomycetota bacterium]
MDIAKVVGSVTSVSKMEQLKPVKLYVVHILDSGFKGTNNYTVAVDTVGAGYGDLVLITTGSAAKMTDLTAHVPTDTSIVARIDTREKEE